MANRSIGKVTTASATGGGVGAAIAAIIVWALNQAGIDAGAIEAAISVVLSAGLAILGGYLVPSNTPGKHVTDTSTDNPGDAFDDLIRGN